MTVERSAGLGIPGTPYMAGGGYTGKTEELDAMVRRAAEMLDAAFDADIQIRFNSDRRSGGAWLDDGITGFGGCTGVGLCVDMRHKRPGSMTDEEWWTLPFEEMKALPEELEIRTFIRASHLRDPALANSGNEDRRYADNDHPTLEDGLAFLQAQAIL